MIPPAAVSRQRCSDVARVPISARLMWGLMVDAFADWFESHAGLAGWAQAGGATIPIAVTWFLARSESRATRSSELEQLKMALFLVADAFDHLARANRLFADREHIARSAERLVRNVPLRHARESMVRAEERGGLPVAALSAVVSCSADVSRALEIARRMSGRTWETDAPAFTGAVGTLRNRLKALAATVHKRGGRLQPGDPVVLNMWLRKPWPIRCLEWLRRQTTGRLFHWSVTTDSPLARAYQRLVFGHELQFTSTEDVDAGHDTQSFGPPQVDPRRSVQRWR